MLVSRAEQPYLDSQLAGVYDRGNEMPDSSLRAWAELIGSFSPVPDPAVLDVGGGTGMLALSLIRWCGVRQVTVADLSAAMIRQAPRDPRARYVVADAAALPVRSAVFDLALLSRVVHHLPDRRQAAAGLKRALRPGGVVVIRTTVRERLDALVYEFWPELRPLDAARFPAQDEITADFAAAGLRLTAVRSFAQAVQPSLRAWRDAIELRPQSKFRQLTDAQFGAGLDRLSRAADAEARSAEVTERYDVLTFAA